MSCLVHFVDGSGPSFPKEACGPSSKHVQINRVRLEDARAQVAHAEAKLVEVEETITKFQRVRCDLKKQLKAYKVELKSLEVEMAAGPTQVPVTLRRHCVTDLSVPAEKSIWRARHEVMATNFCNVLLRIKREGARRFQDSMWQLWQAAEALDPSNADDVDVQPRYSSLHSCYNLIADLTPLTARKCPLAKSKAPYGTVAIRWLLSFEANAEQLKDEHARIFEENGAQSTALKRLVCSLCKGLNNPGTRKLQARTLTKGPRMPTFGLSANATEVLPELEHIPCSWAVLPLVWLPLALYVRSTTHLYEMLDRLHCMQSMSASSSLGSQSEEELHEVLDRDQRHYSYLIFAVTSALQTLIFAKSDLGRNFPYDLLASSPPASVKGQVNRYPLHHLKNPFDKTAPIFRGIWVPGQIDEERAMCQYSFQSFSRTIEGVAQVLSFYAHVDGSPVARMASTHKHILILIARQRYASEDCLAMPVQLMDGPRNEQSEMEVMLPPFAQYEFENDLALTSADFGDDGPNAEGKNRLELLHARWKGFELPSLLLSLLQRETVDDEFPNIRTKRPFVSVRFIRKITYAESMRKLFSDSGPLLYDFGESS